MTLLVLATWAADLKMDVESELNIVTVFGQVIVAKDAVEACTVKEGLHVVPVAGHFESGVAVLQSLGTEGDTLGGAFLDGPLEELAPTVAFTPVSTDVDPVVTRHLPLLQACAADAPVTAPETLSVKVAVEDGVVSSVYSEPSTTFSKCVMASVMSWQFGDLSATFELTVEATPAG